MRTMTGKLVEVEHASCSVEVGGRVLVQSHLRDLTDRNHAWRELQRWNDELDARVRERTAELTAANKALESFTHSVAHDLRSPVARINGFATVLLESSERQDFEKLPHYARRVVDNARVMSEMIDGMLLLSRADRAALDFSPVDTAALIQDCIAQLDESSAKLIEVRSLPDCRGDRALVREVWNNLIANALKYSAQSPSPKVVLSGEEADGECRFCVEDNGIGFDDAEAADLFRTFHRLSNAQGFAGTGIGLSIVKRIVTRHGGRVWAKGIPGAGAQFHFTLPAG
jgi:signal transduction histidine kinase